MKKSLLFIPDISGFTNFVQNTEVEHSQHVIAELLEILIHANNNEYQLAEVEGDALFFFKEEEIPSIEKLLSRVESMFTAFYGHLKLLETNRVCPCHACRAAPNLNLKIIAHSGELQFISIQENRKPFGAQVIQVHRMMKNSVNSENYVLISESLKEDIMLVDTYHSKLFNFKEGQDNYDGKDIKYLYSTIDQSMLKFKPFEQAKKLPSDKPPTLILEDEYSISAPVLFEYLTNLTYREQFVFDSGKYFFDKNEVNKIGSKHLCVLNGRDFNFVTVTKDAEPGQLVYGEMTPDSPMGEMYTFFIVTPLTDKLCHLRTELYIKVKSPIKKIMLALFVKRMLRRHMLKSADNLRRLIHSKNAI
jgi:Protein of unknown function (DUF2652)